MKLKLNESFRINLNNKNLGKIFVFAELPNSFCLNAKPQNLLSSFYSKNEQWICFRSGMYHRLREENIRIPNEMEDQLQLLHSYLLVKAIAIFFTILKIKIKVSTICRLWSNARNIILQHVFSFEFSTTLAAFQRVYFSYILSKKKWYKFEKLIKFY